MLIFALQGYHFARMPYFRDGGTSSPSSHGLRGLTYVVTRLSPLRAPIVTQTCFVRPSVAMFVVSRYPVHLIRVALSIVLLPNPPLDAHSVTTFLMKSIFRRKSFAAGMPCSSMSISGLLRDVAVVRPRRVEEFLVWKLRRVWRGYESIALSSSAVAPMVPLVANLFAASSGRCQK